MWRTGTILRIFLLLMLSGISARWSVCLIEQAEAQMVTKVESKQVLEKNDPYKETAGEFLKQSTEFQGWTVLILGGVIAILITTKVHSNSRPHWTFILFGPAIVFLFYSFLAAWELKKRYNYLLLHNNFADVTSLSSHLDAQFKLLGWATGVLMGFAAVFLFLTLAREIKPDEKEKT